MVDKTRKWNDLRRAALWKVPLPEGSSWLSIHCVLMTVKWRILYSFYQVVLLAGAILSP